MTHQRQTIRETIYSLIDAGKTFSADIYKSRYVPLFDVELPAVLIYSESESSQLEHEAPRILNRELSLRIEILDKLSEDVEDILDTIAEDIERIIALNPFLGLDYIQHPTPVLTGSNFVLKVGGEKEAASLTLSYTIEYNTDEPKTAGITYDDFETIGVEYDFPPGDGTPEAEDEIDVVT